MPSKQEKLFINVPYPMVRSKLEEIMAFGIGIEVYINNQVVYEVDLSDAKQMGRELDERGIMRTVHAPFMDLSPGGVDKEVRAISRDKIKRAVEIANIIGAEGIVCHGAYDKWRFGFNEQLWLDNSVDTWTEVLREAGNLTVMIENIFDDNPSTIIALLDRFKDKLWSCFDTGHFNLFSKVSLEEWLVPLRGRIREFHIHDNHGKSDEHLPVGRGIFPFRELKPFLSSMNGLFFTAETPSEASAADSLQCAREFLN